MDGESCDGTWASDDGVTCYGTENEFSHRVRQALSKLVYLLYLECTATRTFE